MDIKQDNAWRNMVGLAAPRRLSAHGAAYSWFVRAAKYALPVLALVLMGLVIATLTRNPMQDQLTQLPADEQTVPGRSELIGARYEGVDSAGKPFLLTADKAVRVLENNSAGAGLSSLDGETVDLMKPRAEMKMAGDRAYAISASEGRFVQDDAQLNLKGGVRLDDGRGNEMWLDKLNVDLTANALTADTPVRGRGPDGAIDAEGLRLEDGGEKVIFTGRTTLTLPAKGSPAP